jgi:predicted  nucleic acid-binding Zn-ribbon protein
MISVPTEKGKKMAKEICADCGKVFDGGAHQFFCLDCRKRRLSESAKARNLNKLGNDAYSEQQARRKAERREGK